MRANYVSKQIDFMNSHDKYERIIIILFVQCTYAKRIVFFIFSDERKNQLIIISVEIQIQSDTYISINLFSSTEPN